MYSENISSEYIDGKMRQFLWVAILQIDKQFRHIECMICGIHSKHPPKTVLCDKHKYSKSYRKHIEL